MRVSLCLLTVWLFLACADRARGNCTNSFLVKTDGKDDAGLGNTEKVSVCDLWHQKDLGEYKGEFWAQVP